MLNAAGPWAELIHCSGAQVDNTILFFRIRYTDEVAVDASTILTGSDAIVEGPNGYSELAQLEWATSSADAARIEADYTVVAPGGVWDSSGNGHYTISMRPNEVSDTAQPPNYVPATVLHSLDVELMRDTTPPTATVITAPNVHTAGGTTYDFTIRYTDDTTVHAGSIGDKDVEVTGSGNTLVASLVARSSDAPTSQVDCTYRVVPPGGAWDESDDGQYEVSVCAREVSDTAANYILPGQIGSFTVLMRDTETIPPAATLSGFPELVPAW